MLLLDVVKSMYKDTGGTLYVIMIYQIDIVANLLHYFYSIIITSKNLLGTYTFTNISKHVFKICLCLLRMQQHGCQIYKLRLQLGLDLGSAWSVLHYSNVRRTMSDYQGATSSQHQSVTVYCTRPDDQGAGDQKS